MIGVVDYGVGNLYSLTCSLKRVGASPIVTRDEELLRRADRLILPGVGAFGDALAQLRKMKLEGLIQELARLGKPLMGICLGMQLLFDSSEEYGQHQGLGLIHGTIKPLAPQIDQNAKVPHMGWNSLNLCKQNDPLLKGVSQGDYVYYVHSYYAVDCEKALVAASDYAGVKVAGMVRSGNVCGTQFHPEKSGEVGLRILQSFVTGEENVNC